MRKSPVFLFFLFMAVATFHAAHAAERRVAIFVTNDVHGYAECDDSRGRIGYALLKGMANRRAAEGCEVFLLDAGDAFSGSILAQFDSGKSIAALMGKMGYRAMVPGNHAFDYNMSESNPLYYTEVLLEAIKANGTAEFAAVASGLLWNGGAVPGMLNEPLVIIDDTAFDPDGLRVAVVGILTPYVASKSNRAGLVGYDFGLVEQDGRPDHDATKSRVMAALAEAVKAYDRPNDIVVVLSHTGFDGSADYAHGQISGRDLASTPNVNIVADAHSHNRSEPEIIGDALYANSGRYLEGFLEITLSFREGELAKRLEVRSMDDMAGIRPDPVIEAAVAAIVADLGLDEILFVSPDSRLFTDDNVNIESTPLGRLICQMQARAAKADLVLMNSGGIRTGLPGGGVSVGDIRNVCPFLNNLLTFDMTGSQIVAMLDALPDRFTNGFPQLYGMTVHAWTEGEGGRRLRVAGVVDPEGVPIDGDKLYRVALNSFMASGGDGFTFASIRQSGDCGDSTNAVLEQLRAGSAPDFAALRQNDTLIIHPDQAAAEQAMERAAAEACAGVAGA